MLELEMITCGFNSDFNYVTSLQFWKLYECLCRNTSYIHRDTKEQPWASCSYDWENILNVWLDLTSRWSWWYGRQLTKMTPKTVETHLVQQEDVFYFEGCGFKFKVKLLYNELQSYSTTLNLEAFQQVFNQFSTTLISSWAMILQKLYFLISPL